MMPVSTYSSVVSAVGMSGEVLTQGRWVSAHSMSRVRPSTGMTCSSHFSCPASGMKCPFTSCASSPMVRPWRSGMGYKPMNVANSGFSTGPCALPPSGFGRSMTTTGTLTLAHSCMTYASVLV